MCRCRDWLRREDSTVIRGSEPRPTSPWSGVLFHDAGRDAPGDLLAELAVADLVGVTGVGEEAALAQNRWNLWIVGEPQHAPFDAPVIE